MTTPSPELALSQDVARGVIWWNGVYPNLEQLTDLGRHSLAGHLGIEFVDVGEDWVQARMPVDHRTHQPFGRLHGGASVALAETVASIAGAVVVDPDRYLTVGTEINANHLRPAFSGSVTATARAELLGRRSQVWSIRIENEQGKLVCIARMTAAVITKDRA
jgi:1,4-dihydroxy-2-naphthoyl-CoA hydrolase